MAPEAVIRSIADAHKTMAGALTPILVEINRQLGCVPLSADAIIADVLNISRADVAGVVSFYSDFRRIPPGRAHTKLCRAEACQAAGGDLLAAHVKAKLGCGFGETTADGAATLEAVYCFGNCALAPAAEINGTLIGRATPAAVDAALLATPR